MKTRRRLTVGFFVATMMALGAGPAQAVTSAGPYYAEPSWDQKLACTTTADCPRFIVLSNWGSEAVLDRETGLVWEKSPASTQHRWTNVGVSPAPTIINARSECTTRTVGGRQGWRLPSVHELASLVDPNNFDTSGPPFDPALPPGHPFTNVRSNPYWSATTNADGPTDAWYVDFSHGQEGPHNKADFSNFVWCVRGAMQEHEY
jgi:uncharacterized protein DUF1566